VRNDDVHKLATSASPRPRPEAERLARAHELVRPGAATMPRVRLDKWRVGLQ
jgi:hypothetical protein